MKLATKLITTLALTASCLVVTLPSLAEPSDGTQGATIQASPSAKAPNCKDPKKLKDSNQKSYCFAVEGAKKKCKSTYGVTARRKCRERYMTERSQPWNIDGTSKQIRGPIQKERV
jgi:hypothetical protein